LVYSKLYKSKAKRGVTMLKLYSTGELARKYNCCRETIKYWIKTGKLHPSTFVNREAFFTEETLVDFESGREKNLATAKQLKEVA
jgi:hypothetical protein